MRNLAWCLVPALVAAALLAWGGPPYARFLAGATTLTRDALPPSRLPGAVAVDGSVLIVRTEPAAVRVDTGAIAWDLPVLLCLWAWVVRRRWTALALVSLAFVALHVAVTDIEIRKALGDGAGWPYGFTRAWLTFGSSALPVFAVALAWALFTPPRPPPR